MIKIESPKSWLVRLTNTLKNSINRGKHHRTEDGNFYPSEGINLGNWIIEDTNLAFNKLDGHVACFYLWSI